MFHMSYQPSYPQPQPVPPARRPATVTLAAILMFLIALLGVVSAITSLSAVNQIVDRFRELAARTDASLTDIDNLAGAIRGVSVATAVFALLFAIVLVALAFGILRGNNVARVLTWIICGLGVLCGCCSLGSVIWQNSMTSFRSGDVDDQTAEQLAQALQDSYPGWLTGTSGTLSALQLLGYIAIAILLALPAASAFFRRPAQPQPQWQPPPAM
jgi:hypothetical protein